MEMNVNIIVLFYPGARSCPGEIHTRMESFLVISNLLHKFNMAFPPGSAKPELRMQDKFFFKVPPEFQVVFTPR